MCLGSVVVGRPAPPDRPAAGRRRPSSLEIQPLVRRNQLVEIVRGVAEALTDDPAGAQGRGGQVVAFHEVVGLVVQFNVRGLFS
jgi:hypothetical protein